MSISPNLRMAEDMARVRVRNPRAGPGDGGRSREEFSRQRTRSRATILPEKLIRSDTEMIQYHQLLRDVLAHGKFKPDRTGTGTYAIFGTQARFPLAEGFPLLTTKKLHLRSIIYELLWFLRGDTNIKYLNDNGVTIWNEWADADGELGPVYGKQWRRWATADGREIDQIAQLIEGLRHNPDSRRHIVTAW